MPKFWLVANSHQDNEDDWYLRVMYYFFIFENYGFIMAITRLVEILDL